MSKLIRTVVVCLSFAVASACQAKYPTEPTTASAIALMIHSGALAPVEIGTNSPTFQAFALDSDGAWRNVTAEATWTSSDPGVARLLERSRFFPVSPGAITITARAQALEATANMVVIENVRTVPPPYPLLTLFPNIQAQVGTAGSISALFQDNPNSNRANVTSAVSWTSDDPRVATVDGNGIVRSIAVGRTVIRAEYGGSSPWFYLTVAPR